MTNLLIMGASRGIGLEAAKSALQQGYRVTAFARSAGSMRLQHSQLKPYAGDALRQEDAVAALQDVDAVIMALGIRPSLRRTFAPVTLFSEATRVLLNGMAETGVRRLVAVTGLGASESRAAIPFLARPAFELALGNAYDDKGRQERLIANSDTGWTIIRPGILTNGAASSAPAVLEDPADWGPGLTSRADVGAFAVTCAAGNEYLLKAPVILSRRLDCEGLTQSRWGNRGSRRTVN